MDQSKQAVKSTEEIEILVKQLDLTNRRRILDMMDALLFTQQFHREKESTKL